MLQYHCGGAKTNQNELSISVVNVWAPYLNAAVYFHVYWLCSILLLHISFQTRERTRVRTLLYLKISIENTVRMNM